MEEKFAVELKQIKKHFGPVKANDGVDLRVRRGEILAILGENGSGKSTLMNILSGLYAPDSGEILLNGERVHIASPGDALERGIGMIHQHFKLVDALPAWENVIGGMKQKLFLNKKNVIGQIRSLCEKYGLQIDPEKRVHNMTIGEKQTVEIVKALYRGADVLILDEPTAVLTVQETDRLFDILREMKAQGCAVIIITHKLQEVMDVSDRVTVLRKGVSVADIMTSECDANKLAELMVGRKMDISVPYEDTSDMEKKPVLEIRDLHVKGENDTDALVVRDLTVHSYEIVGVAGVADSGQKELAEAVTCLTKATGSIRYQGQELVGLDPKTLRKKRIRIGFVPEDRLGMGLAGGMTVSDNFALRSYQKEKGITIHKKEQREQAERLIETYGVSTSGAGQTVRALSGGNIQKVLLGREIERGTDLMVVAYPVRGLDIGASDYVYEKLNEEKKKGVAILFIAEDLDTILKISDRVAVLHSGEVVGVVDAKSVTKEEIGLMMIGIRQEVQAC